MAADGAREGTDEVLLPDAEERDTLIEDFEGLVRARGWTWLVTSPLLEATPDYFPDRWSGGAPSLRRLLRRLARYAGIDDLEVRVEVHAVDPSTGSPEVTAPSPRDGGVWFDPAETHDAPRDARGLYFHAEAPALALPEQVVAAAARAVAHAWLDRHGLARGDAQTQSRLVDVAGVYLGFGVITTTAAQQHVARSAGGFRADRKQLRVGVLGPRNMAFVLALYAMARGFGPRARKQVASRLRPNPAAFFRAAVTHIERFEPSWDERLQIPPRDQWPPLRDMDVLTGPLPVSALAPGEAEVEQTPEAHAAEMAEAEKQADRGVAGMNVGKPVFRVEQRWGAKLGRFLGMAVFIGGGFVVRSMPDSGLDMTKLGIAALSLAALGYLIGLLFRDHRCSEPKCGASLTPEMSVCPRCGGTIEGAIKNAKERLAAEEALAEKANSQPSS